MTADLRKLRQLSCHAWYFNISLDYATSLNKTSWTLSLIPFLLISLVWTPRPKGVGFLPIEVLKFQNYLIVEDIVDTLIDASQASVDSTKSLLESSLYGNEGLIYSHDPEVPTEGSPPREPPTRVLITLCGR